MKDQVIYVLGNEALHTLLGLKATLADKDLRKREAIGMGSRKVRHQPKANCNCMADFGIVSLRGTECHLGYIGLFWVNVVV